MRTRNYSKVYRILHWLIAFSFILLLVTIFLRKTWMEKNHVAEIIQAFLADKGYAALPEDDAILLAKKIRKPMWDWHIYLGYVLTGLYCIRLAVPFFGEMKFASPFKAGLDAKTKFQYWVYLIFYVCTAISLITGLIIELGPKEYKKPMEEIHELSLYYLLGFMILHFGGILIAELTSDKGLVSRIINGGTAKK
ncbi:cytochrome b/b6 domain-containing protein [Flavobacterium sp. HXWNR69]|uniref:Cytochrome b/b6 domain-containing protein n=1 Tax=Flavobacterium fragile TaxID=2949085 RepID=A0ABT0TIL3_9FLAO|nr:cytochrome b/b6 domain-containing protein [Flavobacterium sp. HXWNR69]MCL9770814.1 cytochrome b/b6 domain-containing protein [Flavobacterium sp. HXWNR69]